MNSKTNFFSQFFIFLKSSLLFDWKEKERYLSPLLFALSILLIFAFCFSDAPENTVTTVFIAQSLIATFFAIQWSLVRIFESEEEDRAFDILLCYAINSAVQMRAWYLAKLCVVILNALLLFVPTLFFSYVFSAHALNFDLSLIGVCLLMILGLASVGILVAALTMKAKTKQMVFALLYFPLTSPIFLAASEYAKASFMKDSYIFSSLSSWLGLLLCFDLIYFFLGFFFFEDLVEM